MRLLYFAWVRQKIGLAEEHVDPPPGVDTVAALITWLTARGGGYAEALATPDRLRVAINQEFASLSAPIRAGDEVALFPPVTGG